MPLDFSPFLMPIKNADYLSDAAKYLAEGDKAAAAQAKTQKEPDLYAGLNKLGDINKIFGTAAGLLTQKQQGDMNNDLLGVKDAAVTENLAGVSVPVSLYHALNGISALKAKSKNIEKVQEVNEMMKNYSKLHPGVDPNALLVEGMKNMLYDASGKELPYGNILSEGTAADAFNNILKNTKGNVFNKGGFVQAVKDSKPTTEDVSYTTVGSRGKTSSLSKNLQVPSTVFGLKSITDEKGNETGQYVPQVIEDEGDNKVTVSDDKLKNAYKEYNKTAVVPGQEQIKIDDAGNLTTIPSEAISGFRSKYNDIEGYLNQEGNKFEEIAHQQGFVTRDANGAYTPEFSKELENFKRAAAYNAFEDAGEVVGGVRTKRQKIEKESKVSIARPGGGSKDSGDTAFINIYKDDIEGPLLAEEKRLANYPGQIAKIKGTNLKQRANDVIRNLQKVNFPNTKINAEQWYITVNPNTRQVEARADKGDGDFLIGVIDSEGNLKQQIGKPEKEVSIQEEKKAKPVSLPSKKPIKTTATQKGKAPIDIPGMTKSK